METSHEFGNWDIEEEYLETSTLPPSKKPIGHKWVYT